MRTSACLFTCTLLGLAGCSAISGTDESRLGPGAGRGDGGAGTDASRDGGGPGDDGGGGPGDGGDATDAPVDVPPMCPPTCVDPVACTDDACVDFRCVHEPNDALCGDGERCNPVMGCVPLRCENDGECDDGAFCNGGERCDDGAPGSGCVAGDPIECDDGASCTADSCDEDGDRCAFAPNAAACADAIDCTRDACDPDATDADSGCVNRPDDALCGGGAYCTTGRTCSATSGCTAGVTRVCADTTPCTNDRCDEAMRMCVFAQRDDDADGYHPMYVTGAGGTTVMCAGGTDCNDGNNAVHPGAMEACGNGVDEDCDGTPDDGCTAPTGDTCASAIPIVLDAASGTGAARGTFSSFANDYQTNPICRAMTGGRDAVYYVDVPMGTWDLVVDTIGTAADTVLGVGLDCSNTGLMAVCNDDYDGSAYPSRIWVHAIGNPLLPTRVYILVDAYQSSTTGDFVVNVRRTPVAPDMCPAGASPVPLEITGGGSVLGFTAGVSAQRGNCQDVFEMSPESIVRFRPARSGTATIDVYATDFVPDLYSRVAPCSTGSELACDVAAPIGGGVNQATVSFGITGGTLYYVLVDGGSGPWTLYYTQS
jgi:hypothetical protein